ncbi:MAG: dihydrodipicolinate reductase [Gemmatimonadota bacterium]|nr:dihydrodipicolinate reductase [Gemmatimonadota bacterium]
MTVLRVAIIGPGRMGAAVADLARSAGADVVATLGSGHAISVESLAGADVAIEFTEPSAAVANIRACVRSHCPVVVGTTGWYDELHAVKGFVESEGGALLWAPNFSLGVAALTEIVRRTGNIVARVPAFDAAIVETHHAAKKDAPSGTAHMLQQHFESCSGRPAPISSVRVGSVPGTHTLVLDGAFEQIRITHEARDRRTFAEGALLAARWLVGRAGVFTLSDVLSTEESQ